MAYVTPLDLMVDGPEAEFAVENNLGNEVADKNEVVVSTTLSEVENTELEEEDADAEKTLVDTHKKLYHHAKVVFGLLLTTGLFEVGGMFLGVTQIISGIIFGGGDILAGSLVFYFIRNYVKYDQGSPSGILKRLMFSWVWSIMMVTWDVIRFVIYIVIGIVVFAGGSALNSARDPEGEPVLSSAWFFAPGIIIIVFAVMYGCFILFYVFTYRSMKKARSILKAEASSKAVEPV